MRKDGGTGEPLAPILKNVNGWGAGICAQDPIALPWMWRS
jgi:hypothetical protein